jgi:hypothetical protein
MDFESAIEICFSGGSVMLRQVLILLVFPFVLFAQQRRLISRVTDSSICFSEDTTLGKGNMASPSTIEATKPEALPDAPGSLNGGEASTAVTYAPTRFRAPEPALKTVKVFNKKFIAAHTAFLGSIVYDAELTHQGLAHHKCVEANPYLGLHPSRGELYKQNLLTFGGIGGLDWLAGRFIKIPYVPYVTPVVETTLHIQGGSKWLTECW